ncbi:MAG: hypothetical protein R3B46_11145 [Phycisphaerales bacterium]
MSDNTMSDTNPLTSPPMRPKRRLSGGSSSHWALPRPRRHPLPCQRTPVPLTASNADTAHWGNTNPPENRVHAHRGTIRVAIIRTIADDPADRVPDVRKWWMRAASVPDDTLSYTWEIAHGWPLPLISSGALGTVNPDATTTDTSWGHDRPSIKRLTIHMPARPANTTIMLGLPMQYPTRIIWRGLIANTLFYALIVWLLLALLAASRRALRRKRNKCEWCAYSLAGLDSATRCPECGCAVRRPAPSPLEGEGGREATG